MIRFDEVTKVWVAFYAAIGSLVICVVLLILVIASHGQLSRRLREAEVLLLENGMSGVPDNLTTRSLTIVDSRGNKRIELAVLERPEHQLDAARLQLLNANGNAMVLCEEGYDGSQIFLRQDIVDGVVISAGVKRGGQIELGRPGDYTKPRGPSRTLASDDEDE